MAFEVARHFNIHSKEVLVCSTGRIGVQLPMSRLAGMPMPTDDIREKLDGGKAFQEAILTPDTCTKSCSAKIQTPVGEITIGGTVKGAGMIRAQHGHHACIPNYRCNGATNAELQVCSQRQ